MNGDLELITTGPASGGGSVGRDDDGRAVFVDDALPGERVTVELTETHRRHARGRVVEVLDRASGRVTPPCPEAVAGCGGCDLMHADLPTQLEMKRTVIGDSIARIGRVAPPDVAVVELPATGYRTTARVGVVDGRPSFRTRHSHDLHPIDTCLVAHPLLDEVLRDGHFGDATEVMIRVGARTGERMAVVDGPLDHVRLPADVRVAPGAEAASAAIHEEVAGVRFRISGPSFFQGRSDGADVLVATIAAAAGDVGDDSRVVDLYAGVGLFAATVGANAGRVVTVDGSRPANADARHNLAEHPGRVRNLALDVARWRPSPADVVVADPSRVGLGSVGVSKVAATKAPLVVLVSCDAGSLGRDIGLLAGEGYELESVTLVDMFPQTHHVEVVSVLRR